LNEFKKKKEKREKREGEKKNKRRRSANIRCACFSAYCTARSRCSPVNRAREVRAKSKTICRRCGDVAYVVDLRIGRFSDFPVVPLGQRARGGVERRERQRGVLISIHIRLANTDRNALALSLPRFSRTRNSVEESERKTTEPERERERERGREAVAEFNFSRSRSSVSARIFIPFRATGRGPLFRFSRATSRCSFSLAPAAPLVAPLFPVEALVRGSARGAIATARLSAALTRHRAIIILAFERPLFNIARRGGSTLYPRHKYPN